MDPIRLVKSSIPDDMSMKVTEILPRLKDGGAFVKFQYNADIEPATIEGVSTQHFAASLYALTFLASQDNFSTG